MRVDGKKWLAGAGAALAAGLVLSAAGVGTAHAATYTKNGNYQFASDTYDFASGGSYVVTGKPQSHTDSSQTLAADGVDLATKPGSAGYADSGVIVKLGRLGTLFGSNGAYVAPQIVGSADLGVNFYFGTNGSTTSFGSLNASHVLTSAAGNNYASAGPASGGLGSADFGTFSSYPGTNTAFTQLGSNTLTMAQVRAAYKAEYPNEGVNTPNPEVWAWIGISGATAQTGFVTSVDGKDLVTSPPQVPVLSNGHVVAGTLKPTRATVAWDQTVTKTADLVINGPGPINGRTGKVTVTQAVYSGLQSGHTYVVTIQPTVNGTAEGKPGRVSFVTPK
jgi:hypothetical protein